MPSNPLEAYGTFSNNTHIKFLHGSQENINAMMNSGGAIEGAFYLADDTQKLYVGRKLNNNVYPVQVSRGVTVVTSTDELSLALNTRANDTFGAIEEGELYYVTANNILAALHNNSGTYEWVQVNPPTGISSVEFEPAPPDNGLIRESLTISTAAGDQTSEQYFVSGNNTTLNVSTVLYNGANVNAIEISSNDTTYALGTNNTTIELTSPEAQTVNGVTLTAASNSINIYADSANNPNEILFNGPSLGDLEIAAGSNGFTITQSLLMGGGGSVDKSASVDPIISYGNTSTEAHFVGGTATLNVYTQAETDALITSRLQTADALSYKGVYTAFSADNAAGAEAWVTAVNSNGGFHAGDVYKVSGNGSIGNTSIKTGDLIIVNSNSINNSTQFNAAVDIIPSGDELVLAIDTVAITGGVGAQVTFEDTNATQSTPISTINFLSSNVISVTSAPNASANTYDITINHRAIGQNIISTADIGTGQNDSLGTANFNGTGTYTFFALDPNTPISYDNYGHVTDIQGRKINFTHNYLTSITTAYAVDSNTNMGRFNLVAEDNISSPAVQTNLYITSETLLMTTANNNAGLQVDLVWGTF